MKPFRFFSKILQVPGKARNASPAPPGIRTQLAPGLLAKQYNKLSREAPTAPEIRIKIND